MKRTFFYVERVRYVPEVRLFKVYAANVDEALARVSASGEAGDVFTHKPDSSDTVRIATIANNVTVLP